MILPRPHSLRVKIALGLLLPLVLVMAGSSYLRYVSYRDALMANLESLSSDVGRVLVLYLTTATTSALPAPGQEILDRFVEETGLERLLVVDDGGEVLLATDKGVLGMQVNMAEMAPLRLWQQARTGRGGLILRDGQSREVYRSIQRIDSRSADGRATTEGNGARWLIADYSLGSTYAQLADYYRTRLLFTLGSALLILAAADVMMNRIVTSRLKQFLLVVKKVAAGNLQARVTVTSRDEIGALAEAFNTMSDDLRRKNDLVGERSSELQGKATRLAALNTLALTVSQFLGLQQVLDSALEQVLKATQMRAGWVVLCDGQADSLVPAASRGLPAHMARPLAAAQGECAWSQSLCSRVLESGAPAILPNTTPHPCAVAQHFQTGGLFLRACVPLQSKDRTLGIMILLGDDSSTVQELTGDTLELLQTMGRQIGVAVDNARLYEQLQQKETLRRQLLERLLRVQEEERKHIARELHDQTGQSLTSLIMTLKVMEETHSPAQIRMYTEELRRTAAQVLKGVRDLALDLRPSILDDLGLLAALRYYVRECEDKFHLPISFEALGLADRRLPPEVETTLYRIAQEALTNVARHAEATAVSVVLQKRGNVVKLIVEDNGRGFDAERIVDSRTGKWNLGLHGMRERAALLGGTVTIESTPGRGTTIFVEIAVQEG
jgi:signal transduction histidine kinase